MEQNAKILVTGAGGLVGKNLVAYLHEAGFQNVVAADRKACDLSNFQATKSFFEQCWPDYVFHCAGYVNGLMGNLRNQGVAWIQNTLININVVEACHQVGVKKIVALGTVAMYPDPLPSNPLYEECLWQGPPHHSEYGYAMAKRGMLAQLETYRESYGLPFAVALSTNLYGPYDRFNLETGHVVPSLIRKFFEAKQDGKTVTVWGDGSARRDFIYIGDAIRGLHLIMDRIDGLVNLVSGQTNSIHDVVDVLSKHVGMEGRIQWDTAMPNGQLIRAYDASKLTGAGFACHYNIASALPLTYDWFSTNYPNARKT